MMVKITGVRHGERKRLGQLSKSKLSAFASSLNQNSGTPCKTEQP